VLREQIKSALRKQVLARLHPRVIVGLKDLQFALFAKPVARDVWQRRIEMVVACPDGESIPRVADAGTIVGGQQIMHNGIRVLAGGYYGSPIREMLRRSRGIHEPQEERVFAKILECVPDGATMLELGAYWGYYSIWFARQIPDARCILVEPHPLNMSIGRYNATKNEVNATFVPAYAGATNGTAPDGVAMTTVDKLLEEHRIERLSILHADIQGAESDMLRGAKHALDERRIDYLFISTHSNELHTECHAQLEAHGYQVLSSVNLDETYSEDGVLVAKHPVAPGPETFPLSQRTSPTSMARE
jgi:hypothetical protein